MAIKEVKEKIRRIEGWLSDAEAAFLYAAAEQCTGRGVIVEIGSWQGKSTACLGSGSLAGSRAPIYAIDPHENSYVHLDFLGKNVSTFEKFKENIMRAGVESVVHPIVKTSEEAIRQWRAPIEFLWIDGDHRYGAVKKDLELWGPFVVEGGIIGFHDSTFGDVKAFVTTEILSSRLYRDAALIDSITSVRKSASHTVIDSCRNRYIANLNTLQGFLRRIPFPAFLRSPVKRFLKRIIFLFGK